MPLGLHQAASSERVPPVFDLPPGGKLAPSRASETPSSSAYVSIPACVRYCASTNRRKRASSFQLGSSRIRGRIAAVACKPLPSSRVARRSRPRRAACLPSATDQLNSRSNISRREPSSLLRTVRRGMQLPGPARLFQQVKDPRACDQQIGEESGRKGNHQSHGVRTKYERMH